MVYHRSPDMHEGERDGRPPAVSRPPLAWTAVSGPDLLLAVAPPPGVPPPLIVATRGRPRQVDTQQHYCPEDTCAYYGWVGRGNLRANGHPSGGPWRQLQCLACHTYFQETPGTPVHGKRVAPDLLVWAVATLAEGLGIRAVARVFEVDPNTVLQWVVEAADHLEAFARHLLHDVHVSQVQL